MHEFMPPKPFLVLSQRTCPIHYFSPKLMFWVVPCHFVAALDTLQNRYRGTFNAWVCASRTVSCFFLQQTCPVHYFQSKTHVLDGFVPFCCRTQPAAKISIGVHLKHEFVPRKPFLVWSQRTFSIHNFRSKIYVYNSAWYLNALLHSFWP